VIKVLQVNSSDVIGSRFNGFSLSETLSANDICSRHLVWRKLSDSKHPRNSLTSRSRLALALLGLSSDGCRYERLMPQSFALPAHRWFRGRCVHTIIHDGFSALTRSLC
jgi:hypothetical protein